MDNTAVLMQSCVACYQNEKLGRHLSQLHAWPKVLTQPHPNNQCFTAEKAALQVTQTWRGRAIRAWIQAGLQTLLHR